MCRWSQSNLAGAWLGQEQEKPKELPVLQELEVAVVEQQVLVKLMMQFVLKMAYLVDSEVGGSERVTAVRISAGRVQHETPFWHSLLPLIPC